MVCNNILAWLEVISYRQPLLTFDLSLSVRICIWYTENEFEKISSNEDKPRSYCILLIRFELQR